MTTCEEGEWHARASELFQAINQSAVPDIIVCNRLIGACAKGYQLERALKLFHAMKQQGVVPDLITYNTLMSAYKHSDQLDQILKIFEIMKQQGVVPDAIT